jgi:hypothetical protein
MVEFITDFTFNPIIGLLMEMEIICSWSYKRWLFVLIRPHSIDPNFVDKALTLTFAFVMTLSLD